MADEALKFEYRISQEASFFLGFGSLIGAILAIFVVFSEPSGFSRWEWVSQYTMALLYLAGSIVLARWSLRGFQAKQRAPVHVELTDDYLRVPRLFGVRSITELTVPLEQVAKMLDSKVGSAGSFTVWHAKTSTWITEAFFPGHEDYEALRATLTERLEARGVPIEQREFRFSRPQFSLKFLFLITTIVAALSGILAPFGIEVILLLMLLLSIQVGAVIALVFGRWWMRAFIVGFLAGVLFEWCAMFNLIDAGSSGLALPGGPLVYPITSLLWQGVPPFHISKPWFLLAMMAGPALSGMLFGLLAIGVWGCARKQFRKHRK